MPFSAFKWCSSTQTRHICQKWSPIRTIWHLLTTQTMALTFRLVSSMLWLSLLESCCTMVMLSCRFSSMNGHLLSSQMAHLVLIFRKSSCKRDLVSRLTLQRTSIQSRIVNKCWLRHWSRTWLVSTTWIRSWLSQTRQMCKESHLLCSWDDVKVTHTARVRKKSTNSSANIR